MCSYDRLRLVGEFVGVSLIAGVELMFWGWCLCRWDRVWVVFCVVLRISFVFGFCCFLLLVRIMVSVEM